MSRVDSLPSRLLWGDAVAEALSAVMHRPARALLTSLGTIVGVAAFVTTTGVAATLNAQVSSSFDALAATEVRIRDPSAEGASPFPEDADARLERLNGVNHAGVLYSVPDDGRLSPRSNPSDPRVSSTARVPVVAATPGAIRATLPQVRSGRLPDPLHEERSEPVVLLGRVAASQLNVNVVDDQPAVFIGDTAYVVIGILEHVERNPELLLAAIIPSSTERVRIGARTSDYEVLIDVAPGAAPLIGRQAPIALRPEHPSSLTALVPPNPSTLRRQVETDVTSLYYALAVLSLFVGTIGIANATLLNVIERRSEIGLRRALGATRVHIAQQVMLEAIIVGALGGLIGTMLGILAVNGVAISQTWTTTMDPRLVGFAPLAGVATGALAGAIPAVRASRTPPAVTLRS